MRKLAVQIAVAVAVFVAGFAAGRIVDKNPRARLVSVAHAQGSEGLSLELEQELRRRFSETNDKIEEMESSLASKLEDVERRLSLAVESTEADLVVEILNACD